MMRSVPVQRGKIRRGIGSIYYVSAESQGKRAEGHRKSFEFGIGHVSTPAITDLDYALAIFISE
jgi:hypothetical protein